MVKIKKNDKVKVIAGKDRGKTGKVLFVMSKEKRVIVEKINMVKKGQRRTQQDQKGGFMEIEAPIHISNVMVLDKKNQPTRVGAKVLKDGSKVRIGRKSGDVI